MQGAVRARGPASRGHCCTVSYDEDFGTSGNGMFSVVVWSRPLPALVFLGKLTHISSLASAAQPPYGTKWDHLRDFRGGLDEEMHGVHSQGWGPATAGRSC